MKRLIPLLLALALVMGVASAEVLRVGMECNYAPFNWTQTEPSDEALPIEGGGYA
ncbi:MAG: ABC transporter substrate-binding protein, partial [Clostridiales bacterium]|nr:ABC transporter substrate-binding protein [Clostridiales bacterium]